MKTIWYRILTLIFLASVAGSAIAQRTGLALPNNSETNPYIALYAEQWELAKLDVEKHRVEMAYHLDRQERLEEAYSHGAVPEATILDIRRQVKIDVIQLKSLEAHARRAEAQLRIVQLKVAAGEVVPMCGTD